jgi:hypothetical protein
MSGALDPMQAGQRHLAVTASRVEAQSSGVPAFVPVGRWCWDVVGQSVPVPCPAGQDNSFDPRPHGSIPPLFPRFDTNDLITTFGTWRDKNVSLHLEEGPVHAKKNFNQIFDLVGTIDGHRVSAEAGLLGPNVLKTFVDLGHGVRGIVVTDATGADPSGPGWNLLSYVDGRLTLTAVRSNLGPGTSYGDTWVGPGGLVFMRVPYGTVGHDELYRWQVTDSSGKAVVPVDLGPVCIDDFEGSYGTCRS